MAGNGPPPEETKRRRNKPPAFDELPAEGHQGDYPALPASYGVDVEVAEKDEDGEKRIVVKRKQIKYLHDTREWYETWAHSPMATKFTAVDWNRLRRLAILTDGYYRRPSQSLASEIRLQETLMGGAPLDRLRAQMRIAAPVEPEAAARPATSKQARDRRSRLTVVKDQDAA